MTAQEQIRKDMIASMKARTPDVTEILRVIGGEFARKGKSVTDIEAIA